MSILKAALWLLSFNYQHHQKKKPHPHRPPVGHTVGTQIEISVQNTLSMVGGRGQWDFPSCLLCVLRSWWQGLPRTDIYLQLYQMA